MRHPYPYPSLRRGAGRALLAAALGSALLSTARADYASEVLSENPLVYYRFNDGVTVDDAPTPEINLGNLGTPGNGNLSDSFVRQATGALTASADKAGSVVGTGMSVPYNAALNNQGSFSAEIWVKPSLADIPALTCVMSSFHENNAATVAARQGWLVYQGAAADGFQFRNYNMNGSTFAFDLKSGPGVVAGAWHHLVVTWNDTTKVGKIYVNGVLKNTSAVVVPVAPATRAFEANVDLPYTIGSRSDGAFGWTGGVDEPAYYSTALTDAQVLAHYSNGISASPPQTYNSLVQSDTPVGYWRMNNAFVPRTPPVAANSGTLGTSANAGYIGGSKNTTTGPGTASGFPGFGANNSTASFATANGFVTSGTSLLNNRPTFTLMGWVKRGAVHSPRGGYFGQNDVLEFGDAGTGTQVEVYSITSGQTLVGYPFLDDEWGFITYVGDGTKVTLYFNGVQASTTNSVVTSYGTSAFNFNIGGGGVFAPTGDFFRGEIDEVALFDKAITPGRVKQLFDAAKTGVAPELVETFPFVTPTGDIPEGQPYSLTVDPSGTPPLTYQWKLNGTNIPGATSKTYTVPAAVAHTPITEPFLYSVQVSSGANSTVSDETAVYVTAALKWTSTDPTNPGDWDINNSVNWKTYSGGVASKFFDTTYAVVFDDTASGAEVELIEDVTPNGIVFNNSTAKNYTFTGPWILGSLPQTSLIKNGTGTVEFANDIVYVDKVLLNEGTLRVGNGANGLLTPVTAVTVTGGELEINQAPASLYDSPTTLAGGRISFIGSGNLDTTATAIISGPGNELFNRAGTVVVNSPNTVAGTVTIASGTVAFDGSQEANRLAAGKVITVNPGATMEVRGVNALPTGLNSVKPSLTGATLRVVSGGSAAASAAQSHAHLHTLNLNGSSVVMDFSGTSSAYGNESFQLNGDIVVSGTTPSSIVFGPMATTGNSGLAPSIDVTHFITVPDVAAGPDLTINAEIENAETATPAVAVLAKAGNGTLRLAGGFSHLFSGTTRIDAGTLEATGTIVGPLVIGASGTIAPGTVGTTDTFGAGSITYGGDYRCDLSGATSDQISSNGSITLSPGAHITFSVLSTPTAQYYEIAKCTGAITGPLPATTGLPPGYSLSIVSNSLVLGQSGVSFSPMLTKINGGIPATLASENLNSTNGGLTVSTPVTAETDWAYSPGSWRSNGQATGFGADNTSYLIAPAYTLTKSGVVSLSFTHRYSFEIDFDGGAVDVSLNGGPFVRVQGMAFSQNPYNGALGDVGHSLAFGAAFVGNSAGHPAFITSICKLTAGEPGDTVQVRFAAAYDNNTVGNLVPAGWEIDDLQFTEGGSGGALLDWPLGTIQYSDTLQAPWTDIPGTGPIFIDTTLVPKRFFRLKP